jgi:hypothetical protein
MIKEAVGKNAIKRGLKVKNLIDELKREVN